MHKDFSLYEVYAKEIIFQMFKYPLMSFCKYHLSFDFTEEYKEIDKWFERMKSKKKRKKKKKEILLFILKKIMLNNLVKIKVSNDGIANSGNCENKIGNDPVFSPSQSLETKTKNTEKDEKNKTKPLLISNKTDLKELQILEQENKINDNNSKIEFKSSIKQDIQVNNSSQIKANTEHELINKINNIEIKDYIGNNCDNIKKEEENKDIGYNKMSIKQNKEINPPKKENTFEPDKNSLSQNNVIKKQNSDLEIKSKKEIKEPSFQKGLFSDSTKKKTKNNLFNSNKQKKSNQKRKPKIKNSNSLNKNTPVFIKSIKVKDKENYRNKSFDNKKKRQYYKEILGDFDFLIHSLDGSVLKDVLTNKETAQFIFYGNFKIKKAKN